MSGVPLETCWAFNKRWNNTFYYKVASFWLFLLDNTVYLHTHTHMSVRTAQYTHFASLIKHSQLLLHTDENLCLYWDPYTVKTYKIFLCSSRRIQNFWMLNLVLHKVATESSWVNNITVECSLLLGCGALMVTFTDVPKESGVLETSENTDPETRLHIPEDSYPHSNLCECLKCHYFTLRLFTGS
jgi:hypothetical protein